jgi:hypothetical protein
MPRHSCDFGNKLVFREGFPIVTFARRAVWLLVLLCVALTALAVLAAAPADAQSTAQAAPRTARFPFSARAWPYGRWRSCI